MALPHPSGTASTQTALIKGLSRMSAVRLGLLLGVPLAMYAFWSPGVETTRGRFDQSRNGLWLAHGWLGGSDWFVLNDRSREPYEGEPAMARLRQTCEANGIAYVFPHLCPTDASGALPPYDPAKVASLATTLPGVKILPWVGGVLQQDCLIDSPAWRATFSTQCVELLTRHPELDGIHINIEPLPDGNRDYLTLLADLKHRLPANRMLSVAAYPPPTRWHPHPEVHWSETYYREIAAVADQLVPMLYDTSIRLPKPYVAVVRAWTQEVIRWSQPKEVILGVPAYEDTGVGYHHPHVENLSNALAGVNAGLEQLGDERGGFVGIAVYADWTTTEDEWQQFRRQFGNE